MKRTHHTSRSRRLAFMNLILILFIVAQSLVPVLALATPTLPATTVKSVAVEDEEEGKVSVEGTEVVYRTRIKVNSPARWQKVESLGVVLLAQEGEEASVLVDQEQLESLARLRFEPHATDALDTLVAAHARTHSGLASSLQPLLTEAEAVAARPQNEANSRALTSLRAAMRATTPAQRASLAMLASTDSDGDGLSDTEEGWWCTDPNNPNSDGDAEGYTDGQEIDALVDLRTSRQQREEYGPPFGPPNAWPDWNGQDGNPATPACNDGDYDTIPDQAEVFRVGSRVPEESTDGDKFDDGQELFGTTYCPGAPTSCGYGNYPRIEYWNYIQADLPGWLDPPGDSIFVAAFPVPEVSVVPSSWTVERVTTVTTSEGQMTQTTNSYETSVTRGQSTSKANTVTWNEWEEVSEAVERPLNDNMSDGRGATAADWWNEDMAFGTALVAGGAALGAVGAAAACTATVVCGLAVVGGAVVGLYGGAIFNDGWQDANKDVVQTQNQTNKYKYTDGYACHDPLACYPSSSPETNASVTVNNNFDTQGIVNSLDGVQYAINQQGQLLARGLYDISYAISQPRFTETRTNGRSWGGSQTTTHEVYEEHTISEGQAFTSGQNWETAWAVDSSRAAELTFDYTIGNSGTDYTRELSGLIFNIYLGDDTEPIISYPAWEQFPNGTLQNLFPDDSHTFASNAVPLTLEQMRRIDLGERLTVVVEDYSYGADELFYQNAVNGGMTVFIEDGVADGDELVDSYVIPTWGNDKVQEVLLRYFPAGYDDDGNLNALWTPEFGNTLRQAASQPTWHEHYLSDISWWNVYLTQPDAGNTPLKDLQAEAGSALLFRFNRDSDRDGYKDSVELRYGTDKDDAASHPQPEILAGYVATREGNEVTVLLKLANPGTFDGYGIDAVIYSPDDSTTIGNNTVGGNGKVRPGAQVAVGSLVTSPDLTNWDSSTSAAKPYASGNYTGDSDRTYTFSVTTAGVIGQAGTAMSWSDGAGNSGTLDLGSNYHAPLPIEVADGLEIGFNTGTIGAGRSFTVDALTPRDTFSYTINSEPYTPPVIIVSYSDPQGSHRFITPVELDDLASDLMPYRGQMLTEAGLDIITQGAVEAGTANTTSFVFNNPHPSTLEDANLYLNFVSDGQLVAEMPFTLTLEAGPTIYPVTWSTDAFSQTYNADADNILLAFWTDSEGNIIDSAARPLNTFAADPQPTFATDTSHLTWDFGDATQGQLLNHTLTLANTGFDTLLTHVNAPAEMTVSQADTSQLAPADNNEVAISLDTTGLPIGAYNQTLTLRTSDPDNLTMTIQVTGTITDDAPSSTTTQKVPNHPLTLNVTILGEHSQGELIEFTHPLGPDTQSLHPILVYSQDGQTEWGTGKYATNFSNSNPASSNMFGDGRDGDLVVNSGQTVTINSTRVNVTASGTSASPSNSEGFSVGDQVFFHQTQGTDHVGRWEFNEIAAINSSTNWRLAYPLSYTYNSSSGKAQVIKVPQYRNLTVQSGGTLTGPSWNGATGGLVVLQVQQTSQVVGAIIINGRNGTVGTTGNMPETVGGGFRGSFADHVNNDCQGGTPTGEGDVGPPNGSTNYPNGNGGGRANFKDGGCPGSSGGGGGNGTRGGSRSVGNLPGGEGGYTAGNEELTVMVFGGGGSGSAHERGRSGSSGASGGGIVALFARQLDITGSITANGGSGGGSDVGGGGGAGGSILLKSETANVGSNRITATGGSGGRRAGYGGLGRIRIEYCSTLSGSTNPAASTQQLDCYMVEQIESEPYDSTRLKLPESFTDGQTYKVQYGRRLLFGGAGEQVTTLGVPASGFTNATLDALLSDLTAGEVTLQLDIGNNGSWDWQVTDQMSGAATLNSSNLAAAFNAYWVSQGSPLSGTLDVPVRVSLGDEGQVLLTNLVMTPAPPDVSISASDITFGTSSAIEGDSVPISAMLHNPASSDSGALTVGFYATVPDFGDWYIGSAFVPNIPANGSIEASIAWETLGFTGEVPVKVVIDPYNRLAESNENNNQATKSMTILTRPDLLVSGIGLQGAARQGLSANVELLVHNGGETDAGLQTVSLYEGPSTGSGSDPLDGGTLIDSVEVAVAAGTTETLSMTWIPETLGEVTLYAQVDRDDAVSESDESNNLSSQAMYVGWGAPLSIDAGGDSDQAYDAADGYGYLAPGTVNDSCGSEPYQTYRQAASGEALEYQFLHLLPGRFYHLDLTTFLCSGSRELRVLVDGIEVANPVTANNEANHLSLLLDPSLYTDNQIVVSIERVSGLGGPVVSELTLTDIRYCYRDSGHVQEVPYANAPDNCGWLNGTDDQGWGTLPYQSVRYNDTGNIQYRFDALEADDAYAVNLTFYEGDSAGRTQSVLIDGQTVLSDIALSNTPQYFTVDVPASAHTDGSILVEITGGGLPIISEIALEQKTLGITSSSTSTSIPLVPGWNLISIPLHPESSAPADVLASIEGSYSLVQRYDHCDAADPWKTYDPSAPSFVNDLTAIDETMGLWVKLSASDTLVVTGTVPLNSSIPLCTGWNLIGYPSLDSQPVPDAFASIAGSYTLIQAYLANDQADPWKTYDPNAPIFVNDLSDMTAGQGYWIKVNEDVVWEP